MQYLFRCFDFMSPYDIYVRIYLNSILSIRLVILLSTNLSKGKQFQTIGKGLFSSDLQNLSYCRNINIEKKLTKLISFLKRTLYIKRKGLNNNLHIHIFLSLPTTNVDWVFGRGKETFSVGLHLRLISSHSSLQFSPIYQY